MWSIDACLYFYHITFSLVFFFYHLVFLSFLFPLRVFFSLFFSTSPPCFAFFLPPLLLLFIAIPFYTVCHYGIHPFCPSTVFGFLWASLQDCHYPTSCSTITFVQSVLVAPLSISKQNYLSCFLPLSVSILPQWIRIVDFLYTYSNGMHQVVLAHTYLFWVLEA